MRQKKGDYFLEKSIIRHLWANHNEDMTVSDIVKALQYTQHSSVVNMSLLKIMKAVPNFLTRDSSQPQFEPYKYFVDRSPFYKPEDIIDIYVKSRKKRHKRRGRPVQMVAKPKRKYTKKAIAKQVQLPLDFKKSELLPVKPIDPFLSVTKKQLDDLIEEKLDKKIDALSDAIEKFFEEKITEYKVFVGFTPK